MEFCFSTSDIRLPFLNIVVSANVSLPVGSNLISPVLVFTQYRNLCTCVYVKIVSFNDLTATSTEKKTAPLRQNSAIF